MTTPDERAWLAGEATTLARLLTGRGAGDWHRKLRRIAQALLEGPSVGPGCCAWCGEPLPPSATSRRKFCTAKCRQADHRSRVTGRHATSDWVP